MITAFFDFREVSAIENELEIANPKHAKAEGSRPRHLRVRSKKPAILRVIIAVELVSVILACGYLYRVWCHNIEMRVFRELCSVTLSDTTVNVNAQAGQVIKTYMEGISEELFEYVWTTEKVEYRTGADMSYSSAGTIDEDKMIRRTGVTHNGWSRIVVDDEEYYIPAGTLSSDIPEGLPIEGGIKGEYQKYALSLLPDFGWDASEIEPLIYLWNRESGWNPNSHNKRSGAHGIPQALPGSKMASEGSDYLTNPEPQIRWGLKYIAGRYGSPSAAWAHFQSSGWY